MSVLYREPWGMRHRCACPCGCTDGVPAGAVAITTARRGVVRCATCYPGYAFDVEKHRDLATLGMVPDVTVKQAAAMKAEAMKLRGAK